MAPDIYYDTAQVRLPHRLIPVRTKSAMVLLQSKSLELIYVQCARKNDLLFQLEEARQLRLRILLLEDENDDLHDQLAQEDDRADTLEKEKEELQERVSEALRDLALAQAELRSKDRELDNAKAELNSLNTISTSSSKLLTEKLALSHELSTIRPELEHLRSQAASYQSLISEKLSLQRQLNTIQVELETERRATQRAVAKEVKENAQDLKLQSQVDSLRQELSKEKRARERAEKEAKKGTDDWEGKKAVLESKLEAMKGKLRAAKEQLKEKDTELQQAHGAAARAASAQSQHGATTTSKNPRKRATAASSIDDTIGTPGGAITKGRRAVKRDARAATLPGDKSTFSMTPFLNRTASIAPESPLQQEHEVENAEEERDSEREETVAQRSEIDPDEAIQEDSPLKAPKAKTAKNKPKPQGQPKGNALNAVKAGKSNTLGKRRTAPALEKVSEEENDENIPPAKAAPAIKPTKKAPIPFSSIIDEPEPKKKKRKILSGGPGKTLFDDEDADKAKPAKSLFGGAKAFAGLSKGGLAGPRGGVVGGFGEISPLKKERKSVR
ncbi:MAG: hypothetical protein M1840_003978 [Geoglossum simile]|nr:MAG: hypothetical protein M1840_003978 [Geoglossum simile]